MFKVRQLSLESSEKPQKNHRKFQKVLDKGGFMCYITYAAVVKRHIEYLKMKYPKYLIRAISVILIIIGILIIIYNIHYIF